MDESNAEKLEKYNKILEDAFKEPVEYTPEFWGLVSVQ